MSKIKVGDTVRSYDFPDSPHAESRLCYVEGVVREIKMFEGCKRYAITVQRDVFQGIEQPQSAPGSRVGTEVLPPVNGTKRSLGGVCDGVKLFYSPAEIDALVAKHSASKTLQALMDCAGGYFPSLRCVSAKDLGERAELLAIADAYDEAQTARGDPRRAYRS